MLLRFPEMEVPFISDFRVCCLHHNWYQSYGECQQMTGRQWRSQLDSLRLVLLNLTERVNGLDSNFQQFVVEIRRELWVIRGTVPLPPVTTLEGLANTLEPEEHLIPNWRLWGWWPFRAKPITFNDTTDFEEPHLNPTQPNGISFESNNDSAFGHNWAPEPVNQNRYYGDFKVKVDILFFDGHLHIENYLDWEQTVESFFEFMDMPQDKHVKCIACKLKGGAAAWWV